jgi:hypothetical protein
MEANNENINSLIRRAMELRDEPRTFVSSFYNIKKEFKHLIYSRKFFIVSAIFLIIFAILFKMATNDLSITIESLESEDMCLIYFLIFTITSIVTWNFYLLFSVFITKSQFIKLKTDLILTADLLYFNPILYTFMIFYYNNTFIKTSFDVFAWMMISSQYFINYCFSVHLFKHANYKISQITNYMSPENKRIMYRFRINYTILLFSNIIFSYILKVGIKDTDFMYKYFVLIKGVYLFLKHIEFIIINELNYKELVWNVNIKEQNILLTLSVKSKIQLINMVCFILHSYSFCTS